MLESEYVLLTPALPARVPGRFPGSWRTEHLGRQTHYGKPFALSKFRADTLARFTGDVRSPRRPLTSDQDFYNRKGLFSGCGERKPSFFTLRDYYRTMESK